MAMSEEERSIRQKLKDDFPHYAKKCLKIRPKSGDLRPFEINKAQIHIHNLIEQQKRETLKVRAIILKGRQQGCSTYIEGRLYWLTTHRKGVRAFILTHEEDATNNLFQMAKRYHEHCPSLLKPTTRASNAKELIFSGLDSGYMLGTAGNKSVGRSSTIQFLHGSEVAFWPHAAEHAKGVMQAVSNEPGTEIFLESTANGLGNYFHEQWQMAETRQSDFLPIFIPWFWQDEYIRHVEDEFICSENELELQRLYGLNDKQIGWRRLKIAELSIGGLDGTKAFMQEYPCSSVEAFQTTGEDNFIAPSIVMSARKSIDTEGVGGIIVGVDPARFGDDRTSIIRRRGRVAYKLESYAKKDLMQIVGLVHKIIVDEQPYKVCIDIGGLGAGVYDRLKEIGHEDVIVAVNGGNTPYDQKKYYNKRAEMWGLMREWLLDAPCQIPDIDSLHADLCSIKYKFDSNTRLLMEKKEDMKKRGIRSPDEGDALGLTFAIPSTALLQKRETQHKVIAQELSKTFNRMDRLKRNAYK